MNPRLLRFRQTLNEPFPLLTDRHAALVDYISTNHSYWEYYGVELTSVTRDPETRRWMVTLEAAQ